MHSHRTTQIDKWLICRITWNGPRWSKYSSPLLCAFNWKTFILNLSIVPSIMHQCFLIDLVRVNYLRKKWFRKTLIILSVSLGEAYKSIYMITLLRFWQERNINFCFRCALMSLVQMKVKVCDHDYILKYFSGSPCTEKS